MPLEVRCCNRIAPVHLSGFEATSNGFPGGTPTPDRWLFSAAQHFLYAPQVVDFFVRPSHCLPADITPSCGSRDREWVVAMAGLPSARCVVRCLYLVEASEVSSAIDELQRVSRLGLRSIGACNPHLCPPDNRDQRVDPTHRRPPAPRWQIGPRIPYVCLSGLGGASTWHPVVTRS